jgi:hypothetical protein
MPLESGNDAGLLLLMGVFGGTGVMCLVTAYRMADPSSLSPFEYFGIPISFTLGWLFFSEAPFDDLFPGIIFIILAGLIIIYRERRTKQAGMVAGQAEAPEIGLPQAFLDWHLNARKGWVSSANTYLCPKWVHCLFRFRREETHCVDGCVEGAVLLWRCPSNYGLLECGKLII